MTDRNPQADHFPQTRITWIGERLGAGAEGRLDINRHIMSVYAGPLAIYLRGSSFRGDGEAQDLVQGFFASRLGRERFLDDWQESGKRLRRWLINAFIFYLREQGRERNRHAHASLDETPVAADVRNGQDEVDRAWAAAIVREAAANAHAACAKSGLDDHWEIFFRHHLRGQPYAEVASDYGVTAAQAVVMARTVANKFRRALRECVQRDGVAPAAVDGEILSLLELI